MNKLSDVLRYIETGLFFAFILCGIISTKLTAFMLLSFFVVLLIHFVIDHEYLAEWADYIFGKEAK